MKNEEILQKAITKAENNGFRNNLGNPDWIYSDKKLGYFDNLIKEHVYEAIIFSHSFVKAFFGEKEGFFCSSCGSDGKQNYSCDVCETGHHDLKWWQYHLQQMVLSENPLEYLAKFLKGK